MRGSKDAYKKQIEGEIVTGSKYYYYGNRYFYQRRLRCAIQ